MSNNFTTSAASGSTQSSLTTIARVKEYAGITTTDYDTKLSHLLAAASRAIEKYCDRLFIADDFTEISHGHGTCLHEVRNTPINSIARISTNRQTVLEIRNTSTSNQRATASVTTTGLVLTRTASAVTTTNTLLFATYPTLATLAAAVTALANGWTATVLGGYGGLASADLPFTIQGALNARDAAAQIEMFVEPLSWTRVNPDTGLIEGGPFPQGFLNISVRYNAGMETLDDDIITAACMLTAAMHGRSQRDTSVKSEKIGDYSYTNYDATAVDSSGIVETLCPDAAFLLRPYRKIGFAAA